jgi:hypothetical protein
MGIACLWLLIVGAYLLTLLLSTLHVAKQCATWLHSTPLSFGRFAWAIARGSLLKQLQWTILSGIVMAALSGRPAEAARIAEIWLATVSVASTIGLTSAYQARERGFKMIVSLGILAVIECVRHHAALPCAVLFSGWQLRRTGHR